MQLKLEFLHPPDHSQAPEAADTTADAVTPWAKPDPAVRTHALEILARLIAAMLAAPAPEKHHE